jgi:hypothetical protein
MLTMPSRKNEKKNYRKVFEIYLPNIFANLMLISKRYQPWSSLQRLKRYVRLKIVFFLSNKMFYYPLVV